MTEQQPAEPQPSEPPTSDRPSDEVDGASAIGRASAALASGTIVSRILGFVNAIVLAAVVGVVGSAAADAFTLSTIIPNSIYALIAGGLLSAVLVPQIVRAHVHDDGGARFVNKLVTLGTVLFLAVAAIATVAAPILVSVYATGFTSDELALATAFAYWCLPQIFFYALYSLLGQVLNARSIFGPFTWAPALNNVIAIIGLVIFLVVFGPAGGVPATEWTPGMIALLGGTATLGIAAQALVLTLFWKRAGLRFRPDFRWRGVGLAATGRAAAWVFGMILITQVAAIIETRVASQATGDASIAALKYAWLIFMLPHSIVTVSIATAYFTRLSAHARDGRVDRVRGDLNESLRGILLIMVFSAFGLAVLAYPFSALFERTFDGVSALGNVTIAYLIGLIPFTILFVLQRVYYALDDTRTPFFLQVFQSVVFVVGVLVASTLPQQWIAVGIALSMTIAGTAQTIAASLVLRRRLGGLDAARLLRQVAWFTLAAVIASAVGAVVVWAMGGFVAGGFAVATLVGGAITMAVAGSAMAVVYFGVLAITRNESLKTLSSPVISRLRRSR